MNDDIIKPKPPTPTPKPEQPATKPIKPMEVKIAPDSDEHIASGELPGTFTNKQVAPINKDKTPKPKRSPIKWFKSKTKRQKIIIGAVSAILFIAICFGAWFGLLKSAPVVEPEPAQKIEVVEPPKPVTEASRLTGVQISLELNKLPTTAVMIENSPEARPQSGLLEAGVVFEAIAEGGITRFLAIYQESKPAQIGPVRSIRPYYLDWFVPFDAPVAHAGGSPEALAQVRAQGIKDLDQFANPAAYNRASHRFSPHNLYTSRDKLLDLQTSKGLGTSTFTGFAHKPVETPAAAPNATIIGLNVSSFNYKVDYTYVAATNSYNRNLGGKPHLDEQSGKQLSPKVVVAMAIPYSKAGIYSIYGTNGSGAAYFFQDGVVNIGTWSKANRSSQIVFTGASGQPFVLNPGQTWITMLAGANLITHSP